MTRLRDHDPIILEEFNGFWKRGDKDSVPSDHFSDTNNCQSIESGFETRDGLDTFIAKGNIVRQYNYKMQNGESLLALDTDGNIWHTLIDGSNTIYGPILSISGMTDFGFISIAGRAYITPFSTETDALGVNFQRGLANEFVYVYKGDGNPARKAAGNPPTNNSDTPLIAYNSNIDGKIDQGIHVIGISFSDGVDDSTAIGTTVRPLIYAPGGKQAKLDNMPIGASGITQRKIWSTKAIDPEQWDASIPYPFYLVKTINDNATLSTIIDFSDVDLVVPFVAGSLPNPTSGGITAKNTNNEGYCDFGLHIIGVVYETDTGYLTAPGPEVFAVQSFANEKRTILIENIPVSPDSFVTKRHLVASKKISDYNGDDHGFQLFFIPNGTIENNIDTTKEISFFDADLLDDASHLIDNFSEIPAGVTLTTFNGRLVLTTTNSDISVAYLSAQGEPEAIDQVDGVIIVPLDGKPITNAQEYRDVLYIFKNTRTYTTADNGDVPSTWKVTPVDEGIGASVHGIAQVLDSGGANVDFLLIVDFSGIMIFNGAYQRPELTWKIQDFWTAMDFNDFANIQMLNDSISQRLYMTLPDKKMLMGDYRNGFDYKSIKWWPWSFDIETNTIALVQVNVLVIGARQASA